MERVLGKNWLTTLGGIIAALGGLFGLLPKSVDVDPAWGSFVAAVGAAIVGVGAKSFNVHSTHDEMTKSTEAVLNGGTK